MKLEDKIKVLKQKRYFDIGFGISSYLKLVVAVVGIGGIMTGGKLWVGILLFLYGVFCYVFGYFFVKHDWYTAEIEVGNIFNLFVKEMRKKIK